MSDAPSTPTYVYFDGWCNACIKSANLFTKLDKQRGLLECVDIRQPDDHRLKLVNFYAQTPTTSLYTRLPNGTVHAGPEAIRRAFNAVGRRHSASWTALPIIRPIVDFCYRIFAHNRLKWFANHQCKDGTCKIDH